MTRTFKSLCAAVSLIAISAPAQSAVIPGPPLNQSDVGWSVAGLGFTANGNVALTGFTFQNQGQADTVVLTDAAGSVLHSLNTPGGSPSFVASVNWALSSGSTYWLLQTVASNAKFTAYGGALPSNSDISIVMSGTFEYTIVNAISNVQGWGTNQYWTAFNDITTGAGGPAVPEPASWAMMIAGLGMAGFAMRRRLQAAPAAG